MHWKCDLNKSLDWLRFCLKGIEISGLLLDTEEFAQKKTFGHLE